MEMNRVTRDLLLCEIENLLVFVRVHCSFCCPAQVVFQNVFVSEMGFTPLMG
jgi:hypothetical protein